MSGKKIVQGLREATDPTKHTFSGTCQECGKAFSGKRQPAYFCTPACRMKFNNRRRDRGAELYDLVMSHTTVDAIEKLAAEWLKEDKRDRKGRPSWIER